MKKILFSFLPLIAFGVIAFAQESKTEIVQRNFLIVSAGPSFPFGDFSSTDINNANAGLAKTGFTIDLKYGHQFDEVLGLSLGAVYGRHGVDKSFLSDGSGVSIRPWEYFGVLAGPMAIANVGKKTSFDLSVLSGLAFVTSPESKVNGEVVAQKDNSTTVPLKLAGDFRFRFNTSGYLFGGVNYTYMKPRFNVSTQTGLGTSENVTFNQKMNMIGVNAGIGFSF